VVWKKRSHPGAFSFFILQCNILKQFCNKTLIYPILAESFRNMVLYSYNTKGSVSMSKQKRSEFWDWIKALGIALLLAVLIRQFLFTNYIVYGESMMPTIQEGNRLIVNKLGYTFSKPTRFDLVVFHANTQEDYIKRVIGLAGDSIEYKDDKLYVNEQYVEEPYLDKFKKQLGNNSQLTGDFNLGDYTGKSTVPNGYVFVMGDNRLHSIDSRHLGFIPIDQIVGEVNLRYWPVSELKFIN
jgi:signal peptidase I